MALELSGGSHGVLSYRGPLQFVLLCFCLGVGGELGVWGGGLRSEGLRVSGLRQGISEAFGGETGSFG